MSTTPGGVFRFYRGRRAIRQSALGGMWNPVYFNYGIAIHGALNVPLQPASHGCIRIPLAISETFQQLVGDGDQVYVFDGKREPEAYGAQKPHFNWNDPDYSTTTTTPAPATTLHAPTTQPRVTQPAATQAPATQPPPTNPPVTIPAPTDPPTTVAETAAGRGPAGSVPEPAPGAPGPHPRGLRSPFFSGTHRGRPVGQAVSARGEPVRLPGGSDWCPRAPRGAGTRSSRTRCPSRCPRSQGRRSAAPSALPRRGLRGTRPSHTVGDCGTARWVVGLPRSRRAGGYAPDTQAPVRHPRHRRAFLAAERVAEVCLDAVGPGVPDHIAHGEVPELVVQLAGPATR